MFCAKVRRQDKSLLETKGEIVHHAHITFTPVPDYGMFILSFIFVYCRQIFNKRKTNHNPFLLKAMLMCWWDGKMGKVT